MGSPGQTVKCGQAKRLYRSGKYPYARETLPSLR